ncbi:acyl-CoA reductase-like NAD-dependent aldehyde dehydrogenase [Streptomyces sp. SAI-133]|uniref:aldehyde dehydrogenase family protein n=1 Tax=unclassified Streptomyces TaxID=2593676 RepID=UPI002475BE37|nr:aldehyde dehydrogenase family protein [Streptomyces sp. SAI-133]MDH6581926.1 acyl-CoA reductase-like NAD-dependent aldehyde dehydrogenase [Streptomyces sp. SAI-133]
MAQTRSLTPDGARADAPIAVDNPATGAVVGHVADASAQEVAQAVARARQAQPGWAELSARSRAEFFTRGRHWLLTHQQEVIDSIVAENGKTQEDAIVEIVYCVSAFAHWAKRARHYLADTKIRSLSPFVLGRSMYTRRVPLGVVGVIGPWNNPLINSFGDAIPALAAGNAVVLKPSEYTPLTALLMERMARECGWHKDVFQIVTGAGATGQALVDAADFVMFTGSTKTGRAVAARAGERLVPCSLELGGKDALIVLADASLERAVNVTLHGALCNGGQMCTSVERVYVEEPVYDAFVARLRQRFEEVTSGSPAGLGSTDVGAMTFPPQMTIVEDHVKDAVSRGARVLVGGHAAPGPGRFFEPTLLVDVDHTMKCMREETFGPTLPVMKVASAEEALRLVNDSTYGLQASIISSNMKRARHLAERLEAGCVTINDAQTNYMAFGLPMGGWKESGLGVRHGAEGIRKYTRLQAVSVNRFPTRRDLHMIPFDPSAYRSILRLVDLMYGNRLRRRSK